jgi:hypothetical protein
MAFTDEFTAAPLNAGWTLVDPIGGTTLAVTGGALRWTTSSTYTDMAAWKNDAARLVQSAIGDFDIAVDFGRNPGNNFDGAGLYVDDGTLDNFRTGFTYYDETYSIGVSFATTKDAGSASSFRLETPSTASGMGRYQRLRLSAGTLTYFLSADGTTWNQWWSGAWSGGSSQRVGLTIMSNRLVVWDVAYVRAVGAVSNVPTAGTADCQVRVGGAWKQTVTRSRIGGAWLPGGGVAESTAVVNLAETTAYLENPGIGYQGWTHDIGSTIPTNIDYRRGNHPEQGKFSWVQCNPSQGVYDWTGIDAVLAAAAARGERASFRIMTMMGETFGGHLVPAWVVSAGATILADGQPDYRTRAYRQHLGTFVDALAARYDGDNRIAFIDITGYGTFNEWFANSLTDHSDQTLTGSSADSVTRRHLIHMHTGGSGTGAVIEANGTTGSMTYSHTGFQQTQLIMPYGGMWATTRYVLDNYPHVGWRNDALFSENATLAVLSQIGHGITERWKTAPAIFEPIAAGTKAGFPEGLQVAQGMGGSIFHDQPIPNVTAAEMSAFMARWGYRMWCKQVRSPATAAAGSQYAMALDWRNTGYAKAYQRMGVDLAPAVALANASGTVVTSVTINANASDWLPGVDQTVTGTLTAPAAGTYTRLVGMVNRTGGARIHLPMSAGGRTDKWYPAGTVTIS